MALPRSVADRGSWDDALHRLLARARSGALAYLKWSNGIVDAAFHIELRREEQDALRRRGRLRQ